MHYELHRPKIRELWGSTSTIISDSSTTTLLLCAAFSISLLFGMVAPTFHNSDYDSFSKPQPIYEDPEGPVDKIFKQNINTTVSYKGAPMQRIVTGNDGLRKSFTLENQESELGQSRKIVVVGDSFTEGKGVNYSQTFTSTTQQYLNSQNQNKHYAVLNAGISGYGYKDYYNLIESRWKQWDADRIVVAAIGNDNLSIDNQREIKRQAARRASNQYQNGTPRYFRLKTKLIRQMKTEYQPDKPQTQYLKDIVDNSQNRGYDVSFLAVDGSNLGYLEEIAPTVYVDKRFRLQWRKHGLCLKYSQFRLSEQDPHPSPKGHKLIAEDLVKLISGQHPDILSLTSEITASVNPCSKIL